MAVAKAKIAIEHDYSKILNKKDRKHENIMKWQVKRHMKELNSQSKQLNKAANVKEEEYQKLAKDVTTECDQDRDIWKSEMKSINTVLKNKEEDIKNIEQANLKEMHLMKTEHQKKMKQTKDKFHSERSSSAKNHRQKMKVCTSISKYFII